MTSVAGGHLSSARPAAGASCPSRSPSWRCCWSSASWEAGILRTARPCSPASQYATRPPPRGVAGPSHRTAGPPGRVPRTRRRLSTACSGTPGGARRRAAAVRATPHELRTPLAISKSPSTSPTPPPDQAHRAPAPDRLHVNTRAIDPTEGCLLPLSRAESAVLHPRNPSTCPSWRRRRRRGAAPPSRKTGTASPSIPRGDDRFARTGRRRCCCSDHEPVHNAIVHNLPGHRRRVDHYRSRLGTVTLTVENTGEKLGPDFVSTLTEPFQTRHRARARRP